MTKNLNTADLIVKLVLTISIIVLYLTNIIVGPFAHWLMILSVIVLVIFIAKIVITKFTID